ncbi:zinc-binding alcohol dehydrogenase family protein [Endozoicomonas sp. SM1973]|uniref:Zinc-type alcohol dehydrogenase-like protein n=1 Tax=Spartinivicinus marinus TaxID=2994442 RepID=A0A853I5S2_9GAMM|nr:zinc-binding alcohol dehydrogenase family protein [Spartinivicinus marinus]MCX4029353.1 zinc-binding alcohol dehydrogenase family protein [Spartinivicinus marinus]NYZ64927.1 zinc-binding alcohol dehydrogenase family protein [Spartinivicinus marinus]
MKAIGFTQSLPITDEQSLFAFTTEQPKPEARDLLVKVEAVSINPVDTKVRKKAASQDQLDKPRILGFDAVGTVVSVGDQVTLFKEGDTVFYAGDISRSGSNAEYQLVDERIVGHKPNQLSAAEAAVLPLTALTAWEALFDRLVMKPGEGAGKTLLIIGGAGGVGSIAIQLAKQVGKFNVIATASRPETSQWVTELGADQVANHHSLVESVRALGIEYVDYIFNTADTYGHWDAMVELIKPQGAIVGIVESGQPVDLSQLQFKSVAFHWEVMFTRSLYKTDDMIQQHYILEQIKSLVDQGIIRSTLTETLTGLNAETLKIAHQKSESGKMVGKLAVVY